MPSVQELYSVSGTVRDRATGEPGCNLEVRAFDRDRETDQYLRSAVTDARGKFEITFSKSDFEEDYFHLLGLEIDIREHRPELFFRVYYRDDLIGDTRESTLWHLKDRETHVEIEVELPEELVSTRCVMQDVYLNIEKIPDYSPLEPFDGGSYSYRRDCFLLPGHEDGTIPGDDVELRRMTALVYRPYTDSTYSTPDETPLIASDLSEPPSDHRVPGTVIYTRPGRRLRIHVRNSDNVPHSFHLHGLKYGTGSDGAYPFGLSTHDDVRSDQICPGQEYTYEFDVTKDMVGAWVFHDHFRRIGDNARLGLFGGLVVRDPCWPQAHYEAPFFMHRMAGRRQGPLFDSGDILPGAGFSRVFEIEGDFDYGCFYHPMFGTVHVSPSGDASANVQILDNQFDPPEVTVKPGGEVHWTNDGASVHTVTEGSATESTSSLAINGRQYAGNTPVIELESGKLVRWYVFNLDLSMEWHNFHPHASHWAFGGQNLDNRSIGPAEAFVVDSIVPDVVLPPCEPGHVEGEKKTVNLAALFPIHCHVEPHVKHGMAALMRVTQQMEITQAYEDSLPFPLPVDTGSFECPVPDAKHCGGGTDDGSWSSEGSAPVFQVHGALLHTGRVILWSGHAEVGYPLNTAIWNPASGTFTEESFSDSEDLFCSGHAFLSDGRLLVGGGADQGVVRSTHIFDPSTETWERLDGGDMIEPRWYPTLVPLNDGRIIAVSGTAGAAGVVGIVEVLDITKPPPAPGPGVYYWETVTGSDKEFAGLYPSLHQLPSGAVFYSRCGWNSHGGTDSAYLTFSTPNAGTWTDTAPMEFPDRKEGSAVILIDDTEIPPRTRILVSGGRSSTDAAIRECEIIDVTNLATSPSWTRTADMSHARIGVTSVILPDGRVMVIGGRQTFGRFDSSPQFVFECEIYDPESDTWATTPPMTDPRQYHSVALLLPDGRVLAAGGVDASLGGVPDRDQRTMETYSPAYLSAGTPPSIGSVTGSASYGDTVTISSPDAANVGSVCLIKPGAVSHHTDPNQRYIKVAITAQTASALDIKIPADARSAPPGYYMLFLLSNDGVPSTAEFIRIT